MGLIFYSFEVLISTIELQSMSLIGPLVVKIDDIIESATQMSVKSSQIRLDHGANKKLIWLTVSGGIYNVIYLHHQWSDQTHTLQFDSTDEYFETVEYEPHSPPELRDSSRKPLIFLDRTHTSSTIPTVSDTVENLDFPKKSGARLRLDLVRSSDGVG